jgi:hypothetical protein
MCAFDQWVVLKLPEACRPFAVQASFTRNPFIFASCGLELRRSSNIRGSPYPQKESAAHVRASEIGENQESSDMSVSLLRAAWREPADECNLTCQHSTKVRNDPQLCCAACMLLSI